MTKKNWVDPKSFGWKPINYIDSVPWPRIDLNNNTDVPLKENYLLRSMDYLDTPQAKIIFEKQADIIQKNNLCGIIDIGCRTGPINSILQERNYQNYSYMGFDTSIEPIIFSQKTWGNFENIEFRIASWDQLNQLHVDFKVDCVIWSGVLLYRPKDHLELFHNLTVNFYNATHAIIQEPLREQKHWHTALTLNTIADELNQYQKKYSFYEETIVDAEIFSGRRKIVEIKI